jgi:hypothetical protein
MKKHGSVPGKTKREVANPWFASGVESRRKKNKAARKARKKNR